MTKARKSRAHRNPPQTAETDFDLAPGNQFFDARLASPRPSMNTNAARTLIQIKELSAARELYLPIDKPTLEVSVWMKVNCFGLGSITVAAALLIITPQALAQPATAAQPSARETITVYAPYVVRRVQKTAGREPLELISVDRAVSFADLDLKVAADQKTLETRVDQAAQDACKELDRRFPKSAYIPVPASQDCVANATKGTMLIVTQLIAAANTN